MKKIFPTVLMSACFATTAIAQQNCHLANGHQIPPNTNYTYGPNVAAAAAANPNVGVSINIGRDAWDVTDAIDRVGTYAGGASASDCPVGQFFQFGAFGFAGTTCATNAAHNIPATTLAYVDWYLAGCAICNTKSVSVNLNYTWVVSGAPLTGEYDVRSMVAHEVGHVLAMTHQIGGVCNIGGSATCAANPNKETMFPTIASGETCQVDLTTGDAAAANDYYP